MWSATMSHPHRRPFDRVQIGALHIAGDLYAVRETVARILNEGTARIARAPGAFAASRRSFRRLAEAVNFIDLDALSLGRRAPCRRENQSRRDRRQEELA